MNSYFSTRFVKCEIIVATRPEPGAWRVFTVFERDKLKVEGHGGKISPPVSPREKEGPRGNYTLNFQEQEVATRVP